MPAIYRSLCQRHSEADFFLSALQRSFALNEKIFCGSVCFVLSHCVGVSNGPVLLRTLKETRSRHNVQSQLWICAQWSFVYSFLRNQYLCAYLEPGAGVCDDDRVYSFSFFLQLPLFRRVPLAFQLGERSLHALLCNFQLQSTKTWQLISVACSCFPISRETRGARAKSLAGQEKPLSVRCILLKEKGVQEELKNKFAIDKLHFLFLEHALHSLSIYTITNEDLQ